MALKVITTIGISIFSNYWKKDSIDELDNKYQSITDLFDRLDKSTSSAADFNVSKWKSPIRNIKERIEKIWLPFAKEKASAEIQTLYKIAEEEKQDLDVILLATDTVLSVVACELIKEWFDKDPSVKNTNFKIKCLFYGDINAPDTTIVKGLQVSDADAFETVGFQNLLTVINKFKEKDNTILNISGGYKAIIPYLTLFAQLEDIPLKYTYEDSEALITVGNLPFSFDFSCFTDEYIAFEKIKPDVKTHNLPSKRDFVDNLSDNKEFEELKSKFLIEEKNDKIQLSLLGKMLYEKYESLTKEDGFHVTNLLGKVMEIQVFQFFQKQFPTAQQMILGQPIGQSPKGNPYDIDVFVENQDTIWVIEVKPQNIGVLISDTMKEKDKMKTLEYKCSTGAFKSAKEVYSNKSINLALVMYHHREPNKFQVEAFKILYEKFKDIRWIWLKPPNDYKGNVNWSVTIDKFKEFNFQSDEWIDLKL
ncbi:MAG: hypothetical protein U5L45_17625 [Saprospiraceae bacterium]|nr:hypothetical protein [Saprospiraceae bacterium]